jgi:N-acylneuraminate cytidylyltransferase
MKINDTLFIIPARGGSKRLPHKNILPLNGKPLIYYTIEAALGVTDEAHICVSTDDPEIKHVVESFGLPVPFLRPPELASDTVGTREVLLHALDFYQQERNRTFAKIGLLQPTSPLRNARHIEEAYLLWEDGLDMVVSVKESRANPYFNLFEETPDGFLKQSKAGDYNRFQDAPKVWAYNGAIYFINPDSLRAKPLSAFEKVKKYVMSEEASVDVDTALDLALLQLLMNR